MKFRPLMIAACLVSFLATVMVAAVGTGCIADEKYHLPPPKFNHETMSFKEAVVKLDTMTDSTLLLISHVLSSELDTTLRATADTTEHVWETPSRLSSVRVDGRRICVTAPKVDPATKGSAEDLAAKIGKVLQFHGVKVISVNGHDL